MSKMHKKFRGDGAVFVPKGQEQAYLRKHGIEIRNLANGAIIAGATRHVDDAAEVKVNVRFPHASYYEPVGKRGVSHLVEHFIFNEPHFLANEKEAYYNAMTYATHMELVMRGRAHHQVNDYGVLPVVPVALEQVINPLEVTESALKSEKNVVLGEIHENLNNDDSSNKKLSLFEKTFFASDHPHVYNPLGTKGEVRGLTITDVKKYHKKVFVPHGLVATVFVDGSPKLTKKIVKELEKRISTMPQKRKPKMIDTALFSRLNPKYKQGAIYKKQKEDKQVKIQYLWLLSRTDYSIQTFAESRFFDMAQQRMFRAFRKKGFGYTADPVDVTIGDEKRILGFVLTIPKKIKNAEQFAEKIYQVLKKDIFETFSDSDIKAIKQVIHKRAVTGISLSERFNDVLTGLRKYDRIIDSEKVHEINKKITPEHLRTVQQLFLSTPPTILIEGDLS